MRPAAFVRKWEASAGKEAGSYQEHFVDLCRLLSERTPNEEDPSGTYYAFQKGAKKPDGNGFADVWLNKHFAWEYKTKKKHKTLEAAYKQVQTYREALGNPPLLSSVTSTVSKSIRTGRIQRAGSTAFATLTSFLTIQCR